MRQMHDRLGAPVIAGVPRKGLLMLTDAAVTPALMEAFIGFVEFLFSEGNDSQPIFAAPLVVRDGLVRGVVRLGSETPAGGAETPCGSAEGLSTKEISQAGAGPAPVLATTAPALPGAGPTPVVEANAASPPLPQGNGSTGIPPARAPWVPGTPVTPGPPIAVDFAMPYMLMISRAAAVLADSGLLSELATEVKNAKGAVLIPALCKVGAEKWAPYFEPGPWHPQAIGRLLQTLTVIRASAYADLRYQVYSPFPPPPWMVDCLRGGPLPVPPKASLSPVVIVGGIILGLLLLSRLFVWLSTPPRSMSPDVEPARPTRAVSPRPSPVGSAPSSPESPRRVYITLDGRPAKSVLLSVLE